MAATKSALTSGMHHCFFRHGLIVFFSSAARTVSYDRDSTNPSSTIRSASRRRFQWSWPSGAGLQAKAIRRPSVRSSILRYRWAWGRSLSTPSSPPSAKRRLTLNTVPWATSRAWATLGAGQPSSVLSRMRARLITRADPFPARTMCSSWLRSSGISRTANFSLTTPPPRNSTYCQQISTATRSPATTPRPSLIEY